MTSSKPQFVGECRYVKLSDLCMKGKSSLRRKDVDGKGPYAVYGASGIVGAMSSFQNSEPYVAVVKDGAGVGRTSICNAKTSVLGTMQALLPKEGVECKYLLHLVRSMKLGEEFSGSTIPHIYFKDYGKSVVPFPSMAVQKQIVEVLDSVEKQRVLVNEQIHRFDSLVKSRFVEMFEQGNCFPRIAVGDVFKTSSGGTPSSKRREEYYEGGDIPWLTSGEVNQNRITKTNAYITRQGFDNSSAKWIPSNSVVIAMYGATAGKSGLLSIRATTNQAVCSIWPNEDFVPEYLLYAVRQKEQWMIRQTAGGAQPNISQAIIKRMYLAKPPIEIQNEFCLFVKQVDKSRFVAQQQIEKLQLLYDSLAQEYFGD